MKFRPCIDIHNGKVKQIVGGSLRDQGDQAEENFAADQGADYFAEMYKKDGLKGGHVILLNPASSEYYGQTKKTGIKGIACVSGRITDRRRNYGRQCFGIYPGRSKPCDCDFLCIQKW